MKPTKKPKRRDYRWFEPSHPKLVLFFSKCHPPTREHWYAAVFRHRDGRTVEFVRGKKRFDCPDDREELGWCSWCAGVIQIRSSTKVRVTDKEDNHLGIYWAQSPERFYIPSKPCKACADNVASYNLLAQQAASARWELDHWRHPADRDKDGMEARP